MKAKLIDYLVCPMCNGRLDCTVQQEDKNYPWSEIIEGSLVCKNCHQGYAIHRGVPRMIIGNRPKKVQKTVEKSVEHVVEEVKDEAEKKVIEPVIEKVQEEIAEKKK